MLLNQTWLIICMNLLMLNTDRLLITTNDSAATSSITKGTIHWALDDAYALTMDKKSEYVRRVRGTGSWIQPVKGTTLKYYTPATRSQMTL
jgi:hypothetical protein